MGEELKKTVRVKGQRGAERCGGRCAAADVRTGAARTSGRPSGLRLQQTRQSSLKERLYIVLSTVFSIFFQSDRRWMNS